MCDEPLHHVRVVARHNFARREVLKVAREWNFDRADPRGLETADRDDGHAALSVIRA